MSLHRLYMPSTAVELEAESPAIIVMQSNKTQETLHKLATSFHS